MQIAKVTGHVVSTQKDPRLIGFKLLTVAPLLRKNEFSDQVIVAVDSVGAGVGEIVLLTAGSSARYSLDDTTAPVDYAIVGIIDTTDIA